MGNSMPFLFSSSYACTTPVRSGLLRKASAHAWRGGGGLLGAPGRSGLPPSHAAPSCQRHQAEHEREQSTELSPAWGTA